MPKICQSRKHSNLIGAETIATAHASAAYICHQPPFKYMMGSGFARLVDRLHIAL